MIDIDALIAMVKPDIRSDEGFRAKAYRCPAGKLTIGYGRNLEDNGVTRAEAEFLLSNDLALAMADLARLPWFAEIDIVRQGVLINLRFNLGLAGLMSFRQMMDACRLRNWVRAADELLDSQAAHDLPTRYYRLAHRIRTGQLED